MSRKSIFGSIEQRPECVVFLPATLDGHKSSLLLKWFQAVGVTEDIQTLRERCACVAALVVIRRLDVY
jgi:hypothetical protein